MTPPGVMKWGKSFQLVTPGRKRKSRPYPGYAMLGVKFRRNQLSSIQDTLSSRAALGLPAYQPLGRVRRASKGISHTINLGKRML